MQRYSTKISLGSYTITTQLVKQLTEFLTRTLPRMLSSDLSVLQAEEATSITLIYPDHAIKHPTLTHYRNEPFSGDIQGIEMELAHLVKFQDATKAIVVRISFNTEIDNNYLYMALQDDSAEKELPAIEQKLLSLLEQHKNNHSVLYRSEWFAPVIFVIGGGFASLTFLTHEQPLHALFALGFGVCIYLFAFRYMKGYSTFESSWQKRWNVFFKWFTAGVAVFILAIMFF